jgi:hypothetical protein
MSKVLDLMYPAHGQSRLERVSATSIKLSPFNGQNLNIGGLPRQVPAAGVTASNSGLAANTLYYVYAYMNGANMALELSTTGHSQHNNGVEIKTGDHSRTLVGMVRANASSQFEEDSTNICVLSYFNRRRKIGRAVFTANRDSVAEPTPYSEVHQEIRVRFLTWADETVRQVITGGWTVNGGGTGHGYCSIDGDTSGLRQWCSHSAATTGTFSSVDERVVSEGYHFGTLIGKKQRRHQRAVSWRSKRRSHSDAYRHGLTSKSLN